MAKKKLRVGLIGYGFMGRTHSNAFRKVGNFFDLKYDIEMKACCARNEGRIKEFADNWGYESYETDWRKLIERDDIDLIDIGSPNNTHCEMALAAIAAGKMVMCEKPLSMDGAEGLKMVKAVEKAGVPNMVWYNYRRVPAVTLAKEIIDSGKLGKIFHYRAQFLQDWTISKELPQGGEGLWRLDAAVAGSGVTGDLLAHCIDTAIWLNGSMDEVTAMTETFIKERVHTATGKKHKVTIDDACAFLARFKNGALATFESTRYARGRKNQNTFELNGEEGSVYFDLEDAHQLRGIQPEAQPLMELDRMGVIASAAGEGEHDFVSRFFAPQAGILEDPVTGSAHCVLTPYWAERLGKQELCARQISERGGELRCTQRGGRVLLAGEATLYLEGSITL